MTTHAKCSPSKYDRWSRCPGSIEINEGTPRKVSTFANDGTVAHHIAALCLTSGRGPTGFAGTTYDVDTEGHVTEVSSKVLTRGIKDRVSVLQSGATRHVVGGDMVRAVDLYIRVIADAEQTCDILGFKPMEKHVEMPIPMTPITGEEDAIGTVDHIALFTHANGRYMMIIRDLKYGTGHAVSPIENGQLLMYAAAAVEWFDPLTPMADDDDVVLTIHQPRIQDSPVSWDTTVGYVREFTRKAGRLAHIALSPNAPRVPGSEQCLWCEAKHKCPELLATVQETTTGATFPDAIEEADLLPVDIMPVDALAKAMSQVDLVEAWCSGVRDEVARRLHAGEPVDGYKLVAGRMGPRQWSSESDVRSLSFMKFPSITANLIQFRSPTEVEKIIGRDHPDAWSVFQTYVTQKRNKPSVVKSTDKRPALTANAVGFDGLTDQDDEEPLT